MNEILNALEEIPCSVDAGMWVKPLVSGGKPTYCWPNSPPSRCVIPLGEDYGPVLGQSGLCRKCAAIEAVLRVMKERGQKREPPLKRYHMIFVHAGHRLYFGWDRASAKDMAAVVRLLPPPLAFQALDTMMMAMRADP